MSARPNILLFLTDDHLAADPGEFTDLADHSEYATIRADLTTIALRDWDPAAIDRRVRESQARRRLITRGEPPPAPH